ncbi:hypothetical protein BLNAU_3858 [Blattamonas nauphoetae]|uniref:Protein kinase domain-containing protein n=1 Tax=Blattamonas nauphoetae TaxID=2049346 RepID=A0ABQ9YBF4_9EUKA|nr:hypothetical protein BLNAU_3858 [Blattamonas nauphoetae]
MSNADVSTVVHSVSIVNVTSSQSKPLFPPKRLSQTCSGMSVSHSVGALQNTIVQDPNLGGSLLYQNSTFNSCQSTASSLYDTSIASAFAPLLSEHLKEMNPPYDFTDDQYENELSHLYWSITKFTSITVPQVHTYATATTPITYTNCSFIQMIEDTSENFGKGGAALRHMCQAPLTITNCRFEECHSEKGPGGAIFASSSYDFGAPSITIDSSRFDHCSTGHFGGAIVITYKVYTSIIHSNFTHCGATNSQGIPTGTGGALYVLTCSVSFSKFVNNTATQSGAGYAQQSASLMFCHFAGNTAGAYRDFLVPAPFNSVATMFGCTESSDQSSSTDEVLFVENGATGLDCSYSSPCGSLSSALSKVSSSQIKTIKVGAGSYGTVSLVASSHPTITQYHSEDSMNTDNPVLLFSLEVNVRTEIQLQRMHLRPLPGLALVSCSYNDANITMDSLQMMAIANISTAPFSFSAGNSTFTACHFEDLSSMQCSLIDITASAVVSLKRCFFRRIDGSSSVITVIEGELDILNCLFRSLTRTSGNGAAGLDCQQPSSLSITASFAHCHSTGPCGALLLNKTDTSKIIDFTITFFDNRGKDDTVAHDIYLIGMVVSDLDIYSSFLKSLSLTPSVKDDLNGTHTFSQPISIMIFSDWDISSQFSNCHSAISTSELENIDLSPLVCQGNSFSLNFSTLPEQINRMQPLIAFSTFFLQGPSGVFSHPILAQSEGSTGPLITLKPQSTLYLRCVRLLTITQHTDPMIVVEKEASLHLSLCSVSSDGTDSKRSIVRSWGNVNVNDVWFSNIKFVGGSCFETFDGSIAVQHSGSHIVVSNLTTTENGAFINSHNTSLNLPNLTIFNCHATNGGALYARDCPSISMKALVHGCSATQNGGGVCVEGVGWGDSPSLTLNPCYFVDCSAVLGGGIFVNTSNYTSPSFGFSGSPIEFFGIIHFFRAFSGCSAQKGAGLFLDGSDMSQMNLGNYSIISNDDAVCDGSDFFFSQSVADSQDDFGQFLNDSFDSVTSFSGRSMDETGRFKHVEVGGYPELSFNLPPPLLQVVNWDNPPSESCVLYSISCSSIHMYLPLFHTKTENGGYLLIPIELNDLLFFFESGVVRKQSALVKMFEDEYVPVSPPVNVHLGSGVIKEFSPFLVVAEEGSLEFSKINFVWRINHPLCSSLDPTATVAITECHFEIRTNLSIPFVSCTCGSLVIKQTSFTTLTPNIIASPLITSDTLSTTTSNSELNLRIEMSHVTFRDVTVDEGTDSVVFFKNPDWMKLDHVNFERVVKTDNSRATRMIVHGRNLADVIEYVPNNGFPERGGEFDTLYESHDEAEPVGSDFRNQTLLLYFHFHSAPTIIVKSTGGDGFWCGDDTFPCASLDESDRHLADSVLCTIAIVDVARLKGEVDLTPDKTAIVSKGGSKVTVAVSTDGSLVNKADTITHSLALESLLFSLTSDRTSTLLRSESGLMTITSCSFTSSSALSSLLVSVTGGVFEMSKVDFSLITFSDTVLSFATFDSVKFSNVDHKSCAPVTFMTFEGSSDRPQVELRDCVFTGPPTQSSQNDDTLCSWTSSLIVVHSCSFDSYSSSFSHLSQGALHVMSSKVKIVGGQMADNNPHSSSFPNMNRNIRCEGASSIELDTSPSDSDTLWINTDSDCVVKGNTGSEVMNSFFVPTLTPTSCSATFTKKTGEYSIVMKGTLLIPCGLAFVILDVANTNAEPVRMPLSAETTSEVNESSITMTLLSNDVSELEAKNEWLGYLAFGQTGKTDSFTFKLSQKQALAQAVRKTLPWLIPLVVILVVLLLLALFVVIFCIRRKTRNQQNTSEMSEQDTVQVEDEKIVVLDDTQGNLHAIDQIESVTQSSPDDTKHVKTNLPSLPIQEPHVEAIVCSEKMEKSLVREVDTLYNALHVNERKRLFAKRDFQKQLALGLKSIAGANKLTDVLTKMSSHWVMFDAQGNACLKCQESTQQIPLPQSSGGTQPVTPSKDGHRWKAPEVAKAEEEKDFGRLIDGNKAAVFSLGLILWEIETGLVPFGELDAINAQRQIGTGTLPKMEGVNSSMVDVIESCLRLEPDDRPTLSTIWTALHSIPDEAPAIVENDIVGTH